ncbi:hypothetical protein DFH09DRAFT_1067837 [Mycena vulgaris]|nr:hypothetical protein DFH09DRAFT_1067837 [Mycena vulgaris]
MNLGVPEASTAHNDLNYDLPQLSGISWARKLPTESEMKVPMHQPPKRGRPKRTTADKANDDEEPAAKKPKQTETNKRKALEAPVGSAAKRSRSRELPPRSIANPERYQSAYGNSARHIYCIPYDSLVTSLTRGAVEEDDHRIFCPMDEPELPRGFSWNTFCEYDADYDKIPIKLRRVPNTYKILSPNCCGLREAAKIVASDLAPLMDPLLKEEVVLVALPLESYYWHGGPSDLFCTRQAICVSANVVVPGRVF